MDNQRLFDLVRHQRGELFTAELITKDEYAELAMAHSAVARLEDYDALLAEAAMLREALKQADDAFEKIHDDWAEPSASAAGGQIANICLIASLSIDTALSGSSGEWLERHDAEKDARIADLESEVDGMHNAFAKRGQLLERAEAERDGLAAKLDGIKAKHKQYDEALLFAGPNPLQNIARITAEARRKALLEAADHCEESDIPIPIEEIPPGQTRQQYANVVLKHLAIELRQLAQEADHA